MNSFSTFIKKFVVFEGIEGVGKTTHINFVAKLLEKSGVSVMLTREPGGTKLGEEIRRYLKLVDGEPLSPNTEMLLIFAARQHHLDLVIKPALQDGKCVLCDRFTDATYAYQGGGRGMSEDSIAMLENFVQKDLRPDLTVLFTAPVEVALQRTKNRGPTDRFERETYDFFQRAQDVYLDRQRKNLERYVLIDATGSIESIQQKLYNIFIK